MVGINGMVIKQCIKYYRDSSERRQLYADVAELADAQDLKSCDLVSCEFESHHPHQNIGR